MFKCQANLKVRQSSTILLICKLIVIEISWYNPIIRQMFDITCMRKDTVSGRFAQHIKYVELHIQPYCEGTISSNYTMYKHCGIKLNKIWSFLVQCK